MIEDTVNVRYMVDDVAAALDFHTSHLGFRVLTSTPGNLVELFQPAART